MQFPSKHEVGVSGWIGFTILVKELDVNNGLLVTDTTSVDPSTEHASYLLFINGGE